ncbi:class I SAM-dependent methyltransferase [Marinactinospora rubrisoli]|uniref:Class I SAM-dependent methyltransferase n=1 Tax=Marinactinospora rubrisoli TaxID=2715399 RepID=A0ABW2KAE6_9ACTN
MTTDAELTGRAATMEGYDDIRHLRQGQDIDWVRRHAPAGWRSVADLGCGTGALLRAFLDAEPAATGLGVDGSAHRLARARAVLADLGDRVRFRRADLRHAPGLGRRFDVIAMTSVLHWLHPDERAVFRWIAAHLAPDGRVLLTTHHPALDADGLGGEDELVRDAAADLGLASPGGFPDLLRRHGVTPMGRRARPAADVAALLAPALESEAVRERRPAMRPADGAEHVRFHLATFGDYFSRIAGPDRQVAFFDALARAAQRRLGETGSVYPMTVRLWRLRRRE